MTREKTAEQTTSLTGSPRCLPIAAAGVATGQQLTQFMSALMSDVIESTISPAVANAAVNAAGKLLKTVELQIKYGTPSGANGAKKTLNLFDPPADTSVAEEVEPVAPEEDEIARLEARLACLKATREPAARRRPQKG